MESKNKLSFFNVLTITLTWSLMCLFLAIFFSAVFSENRQLTITVNDYNEMWVEIPLFLGVFGVTTLNVIKLLGKFMKDRGLDVVR